ELPRDEVGPMSGCAPGAGLLFSTPRDRGLDTSAETAMDLEQNLESEFDLTRRAEVAAGAARARDDAEGARGPSRNRIYQHEATGLREVGVVGEIEELGAELHVEALMDVGVLE